MPKTRHKLFVGIDYGTTFSGGIAYALPTASNERNVEVVTEWPGNSGVNNEYLEKVPSTIAYFDENEAAFKSHGIRGDIWGYEVRPGLVSCSWTKLLLDRHARSSEYDDKTLVDTVESGMLRLPPGKLASTVTTDYLTKLYEHCMKILGKHYADLLEMTPIEFWFTMPAIWSDKAKHATKKAARMAGFGSRPKDTMNMISEPEAGVIAAINSPMNSIEGALEPRTGFLVCDCGGGTVDLTSYVVERAEPMLELRETCPGIGEAPNLMAGGKCGSTSIDRNFHALMRRRFGEAFSSLPSAKKGPGSKFMREFEGIKKDFSESNYETHSICLRMPNLDRNTVDSSIYDYDQDDIKLSSHDLKQCFDPTVAQILALVAQQVRDTSGKGQPSIETIILIGGFGSSNYLWDKLRAWGDENGNIRCISPIRPWSAIARGAALRGLQGSKVPIRKCRLHYGTTCDRPFDETRDDDTDSTWVNQKTGERMVRHCMDWCFRRNEEITDNMKKEIPFTHWYYPNKRGSKKIARLNFYSCSLNKAPDKKTSMIDCVGTINVNLGDVDLAVCESGTTKQKLSEKVYWIKFKAVVTLGSEEGTMQVAVVWNGKQCGSGRFDFAHEKIV